MQIQSLRTTSPEGYDTFTSIVGLDKECLNHPEGASVKFLVYTEYPAGSRPEDSVSISFKLDQIGLKGSCSVRDLWEKKNSR